MRIQAVTAIEMELIWTEARIVRDALKYYATHDGVLLGEAKEHEVNSMISDIEAVMDAVYGQS